VRGDLFQIRADLDRALAERVRPMRTRAATLTALPPCASCDPASCDHALTWWCAGCNRQEDCGDHCPEDLPGAPRRSDR
jgi:hypothetical protein